MQFIADKKLYINVRGFKLYGEIKKGVKK